MATNTENSGKQKILELCAKSKFPPPEFEKQSLFPNRYTVLVWVEIPIIGSDEPKRFEERATAISKRKAENDASLVILSQLQDWLSEYKPPDINNIKQDLIRLTQRYKFRLSCASFDSYPIESTSCSFQSTVEVEDRIQGRKYMAVGQGKGKKDAEKNAAYRMISLLEEVLASSDSNTENLQSTENQSQNFFQTPISHPLKPATNLANYRAKINQFCQQNNLPTPNFSEVDNNENEKRFSTKLSIKGIPDTTVGYGSCKKNAMEEAAMLMCKSLTQQADSSSEPIPQTVENIFPSFDPETPISLLDPNNPIIKPFLPEIDKSEGNATGNYTQALIDKFEPKNNVKFVLIPFEPTKDFLYFASVGKGDEVPFLVGHGQGATDREARNAAAKDCLDLSLDSESVKNILDSICSF